MPQVRPAGLEAVRELSKGMLLLVHLQLQLLLPLPAAMVYAGLSPPRRRPSRSCLSMRGRCSHSCRKQARGRNRQRCRHEPQRQRVL